MIPEARTVNQKQTYFHRTFRATITEEMLMEKYNELRQWSEVAKYFNVSHSYIIMARKYLGIFQKTITKGRQYGGLNSRHTKNGGKHIDHRGYVVVGRFHPENDHEETVYEHKLVMERHLDRKLKPGEIIHHIDNVKSNNDIDNLFLCNHQTHRKCDLSAMDVCYELYMKGLVYFDREEGVYKVRKEK